LDVFFTPDGKRIISGASDDTCTIWDVNVGEKLAQTAITSGVRSVASYPSGIIVGGNLGKLIIQKGEKDLMCPDTVITTILQIWDFELQQYQPLSADCPLCGHRFAPPVSVLETIEKITKKAGLKPEQSPCLELPDEAWEDSGLLGSCPKCGEKLKFNPFVAGGDLD
jgi:hypothetical protein